VIVRNGAVHWAGRVSGMGPSATGESMTAAGGGWADNSHWPRKVRTTIRPLSGQVYRYTPVAGAPPDSERA
jgi:hypothetical protein